MKHIIPSLLLFMLLWLPRVTFAAPPSLSPSTQTVTVTVPGTISWPAGGAILQTFTSSNRASTSPWNSTTLGYQTDTQTLYYSTGTSAGNWSPVSTVNGTSIPSSATLLTSAAIGSTVQGFDANTTTAGNTFNGASQLVQLDGSGKLPAIDGSQLTGISGGGGGSSTPSFPVEYGSDFTTDVTTPSAAAAFIPQSGPLFGLVPYLQAQGLFSLTDADGYVYLYEIESPGGSGVGIGLLSATFGAPTTFSGTYQFAFLGYIGATLQGNIFNGPNELVQIDGSGRLPAVDASLLTNVPGIPVIPSTSNLLAGDGAGGVSDSGSSPGSFDAAGAAAGAQSASQPALTSSPLSDSNYATFSLAVTEVSPSSETSFTVDSMTCATGDTVTWSISDGALDAGLVFERAECGSGSVSFYFFNADPTTSHDINGGTIYVRTFR